MARSIKLDFFSPFISVGDGAQGEWLGLNHVWGFNPKVI